MSDETPTRFCMKCQAEISALVTHCPACGHHQEDVQFPVPMRGGGGGFEIEDEPAQPDSPDPPAEPAPPEPAPPPAEAPAPPSEIEPETQPISSEDLPLEEEVAGDTVRMSVADLGKAWLEETSDAGAEVSAPEAATRKGCLPVLAALLVLPTVVFVAALLLLP